MRAEVWRFRAWFRGARVGEEYEVTTGRREQSRQRHAGAVERAGRAGGERVKEVRGAEVMR